MKLQPGCERHALASNVAADCQNRRQRIAAMHDRVASGRKKVVEEISPIIDVDQYIGQIGLGFVLLSVMTLASPVATGLGISSTGSLPPNKRIA